MPQERVAPQIQPLDLDGASTPLKLALDQINEQYALTLVNETFSKYEQWRTINHDPRWRVHDMLYCAYVPPRVWPGTQIPRSSLPNPVVFEQIETALPQIVQSIFADKDWFGVNAEKGTKPEDARAVKSYLNYVLSYARDNFGRTFEIEAENVIRSVLKYGNGPILLEWDAERNHVAPQSIDLRDIYVDPATPTPCVDDSRAVIVRRLFTLNQLEGMRGQPGVSLPASDVLVHFSRTVPGVSADQTKRLQEAQRKVTYNPQADAWSPMPSDNQVEVLVYYTPTRIIWVLNRQWVAVNMDNPYGFIPLVIAPCYSVLSRFYAMSMADVLEPTQLYSQALLNARLDELNLELMPPRSKKRGGAMTPSQYRWYPGVVQEFENADDIVVHRTNNVTANIQNELAFLEMSAQKRTGVNSMASGIPTPSNANRTMGGIQTQLSGGALRLSPIVKHIENFLIIPMMYKILEMTRIHKGDEGFVPGFDEDVETEIPASSLTSQVRFRIVASSKMVSRQQLLQMFPVLTQYLLQGPFVQQLSRLGMTVDFKEMLAMLQDAAGLSEAYALVREMTPEEREIANQPSPDVMAQLQAKQQDTQTRKEIASQKFQSEIQVAQIQANADIYETEEASARKLGELTIPQQSGEDPELAREMSQIELQTAQAKAAMQIQQAQQKLQMDQVKFQQQMQMEREKLQMERVKMQQQMQMQLQQAVFQQSLPVPPVQAQSASGPASGAPASAAPPSALRSRTGPRRRKTESSATNE